MCKMLQVWPHFWQVTMNKSRSLEGEVETDEAANLYVRIGKKAKAQRLRDYKTTMEQDLLCWDKKIIINHDMFYQSDYHHRTAS